MDIQDKIIKWMQVGIIFALSSTSILLLILVGQVFFEKFGFPEGINSGIIGAVGSIIGGSLTLIGVRWTLTHATRAFMKQKRIENKELNRNVLKTYQLVLLNHLNQLNKLLEGVIQNTSDNDLIGCFPTDFPVPFDSLIRNTNDDMLPSELNIIITHLKIFQLTYYDNGERKSDINEVLYLKRLRLLNGKVKELHDRLVPLYENNKL
ncbi:hypothetical protein FE783_12745 [Paenibacillus mesophilus]|uniref:hypothetical protein n=1 Tax=Paenibacillus mesophilus TaxID=2582849 RepID=UPI00110EB9CB|nr:hypothetical protein [Paenibacillus mesophilus]TMV49377.1 hypothetical protein FE783_12745 [Paenibacillus mesophilus]